MKKFKKALSLLLAVMMVFSVMTVSSFADTAVADASIPIVSGLVGQTSYTDTANNVTYTVIDSAEDFTGANAADTDGVTTNYILACDIDLGGNAYDVTLTLEDGAIFDGNGCKMTGFTVNANGGDASQVGGIFGFAGVATVRNLQVGTSDAPVIVNDGLFSSTAGTSVTFNNVDVYVNDVSGADAGGFCAVVFGAVRFVDCTANGNVDAGHWRFGGFVGSFKGTSMAFENCVNNAYVKGYACQGGFVGQLNSADGTVYFKNCINNGNVEGSSGQTGGFVGVISTIAGAPDGYDFMDGCTNNGNLTASDNTARYGAGGFIGSLVASANVLKLIECVNNGAIYGPNITTGVGGVVGRADVNVTIEYCVNNGEVEGKGAANAVGVGGIIGAAKKSATISHCTNNGYVDGDRADSYNIAGIAGYVEYTSNISYCTNNGKVVGYNVVGGIIGQNKAGTSKITYSHNNGSIEAKTNKAGGFVGTSDPQPITVENSVNYGNVCAPTMAGGFIGRHWTSGTAIEFKNCANYGTITSTSSGNAGGFVGEASTAVTATDCINYGDVTSAGGNIGGFSGYTAGAVTLSRCTNLGNIKATGTGGRQSEFIAGCGTRTHTLTDCYAFGSLTGNGSYAGKFIGNDTASDCSGNKYITKENLNYNNESVTYNSLAEDSSSQVTRDDAKALLEERYADLDFACSETAVYLATPRLAAVQATTPADGYMKVRFVATTNIAEISDVASQLGFKVNIAESTTPDKGEIDCKYVYGSINATENGKVVSYDAASMGADNIFLLSVKDVPSTGTVTFTVTPYVRINGTTSYGTAYTVIYNNGVCTSFTAVAN